MGRGNKNNLKVPTSEEARINGAKGGIASGQARRDRKLIQEALKKALEGNYDVDNKNIGGYDALAISMIKQAINGSVKAFVAIRDSIGEKPKETVEFENDNLTDIKIKFVNKSNANKKKEKDPKIVGDYTPPSNTEEEYWE